MRRTHALSSHENSRKSRLALSFLHVIKFPLVSNFSKQNETRPVNETSSCLAKPWKFKKRIFSSCLGISRRNIISSRLKFLQLRRERPFPVLCSCQVVLNIISQPRVDWRRVLGPPGYFRLNQLHWCLEWRVLNLDNVIFWIVCQKFLDLWRIFSKANYSVVTPQKSIRVSRIYPISGK